MLRFILYLFFSLCVFLVQAQPVLNGVDAEEGAYPWMGKLDLDGSVRCGATLIAPNWVLTAGHCTILLVDSENPINFNVIMNPYNQMKPASYAEYLPVKRLVYPTEITTSSGLEEFQDIVLLELERPSIYDPISIAAPGDSSFYYKQDFPAKVIGWGATEQATNSNILQDGDTQIFPNDTCVMMYEQIDFGPRKREFCAGYHAGFESSGAGVGDSGGPLFVEKNGEWLQIGVVSRGGNGTRTIATHPAIYTRIELVYDWIVSLINDVTQVENVQLKGIKVVNQQSQLSIEMETVPEKGELIIIDEIGRQIYTKILERFDKSFSVDMSMLNTGFYSVFISSQKGYFVEKFIKY